MCGRANLPRLENIIKTTAKIDFVGNLDGIHRQATPGQNVYAIMEYNQMRILNAARWGFDNEGNLYNARIETADTKPTWARAWQKNRCVIPIESFYEGSSWFSGPNQQNKIMWAAGLWQVQRADRTLHLYATMLTQPSNNLISKYHPRMPVIISDAFLTRWLTQKPDKQEVMTRSVPNIVPYQGEPYHD